MTWSFIRKAWPAAAILLWGVPAAAEPFRLTVEKEALVATGTTKQGQVIFFGVAREIDPDDVVNVVPRTEIRTDEDGDGQVRFPLGGPVAARSAWAAVDLASGGFDAAAPEDFRLKKVNFRGPCRQPAPTADLPEGRRRPRPRSQPPGDHPGQSAGDPLRF